MAVSEANLLEQAVNGDNDALGGNPHAALIELFSSDGSTPSRYAAHDQARSAPKDAVRKLPLDYRKVLRG